MTARSTTGPWVGATIDIDGRSVGSAQNGTLVDVNPSIGSVGDCSRRRK